MDIFHLQVMSGELKLIEKSYIEALGKVTQCQKIIDRGIRTPGQILESYVDKLVSKGSNY